MKKILLKLLAVVLVLPMVFSALVLSGTAETGITPFVGLVRSRDGLPEMDNLATLVTITTTATEDGDIIFGTGDVKKDAAEVKMQMDALPAGMRHLYIGGVGNVIGVNAEDVVFLDYGMNQLEEKFTAFIKEYADIGGKLDGIVLQVEYLPMNSWYIYSREYFINGSENNTEIYNDIVNNPRFDTEIRPLLDEREFKYFLAVEGEKSEIYSIWPYLPADQAEECNGASTVWDLVMRNRLNAYLDKAMYEPMLEYFPDALFTDYQSADSNAWLKGLANNGGASYIAGNSNGQGSGSNYNTYSYRPNDEFFKDSAGNAIYKNPPSYNKAIFERDAYNMFMWDINLFKDMYAATETKQIGTWLAKYDFNDQEGSPSNTPYYAETILHIGMLNPQPIVVNIYDEDISPEDVEARAEVVSQILSELTRVAGASDRKPIETPSSWNDGFVLSGMYAGGKNIWRLTPDTTDGLSVADFKVKDTDPTFTINGRTITFPGGKIITNGEIGVVGTCGYWVETPEDTYPVLTSDADRYSKIPAYVQDFEGSETGSKFEEDTALPLNTWSITSSLPLQIEDYGGNKVLALTGNTRIRNLLLPQNVTAGDSFAKEQVWEVSFTLPTEMSANGVFKVLYSGNDGGVKYEGGRMYYDYNGTYKLFGDVTLAVGQKYTLRRELNFTISDSFYSSYYLYDAAGTELVKALNIPMPKLTLPIDQIGFATQDMTTKVLIDDYKLFAVGAAAGVEAFAADTGILYDTIRAKEIVYRVAWFNGSSAAKTVHVMAAYGESTPVEIAKFDIQPGCDGVNIGELENKDGAAVRLSVQLTDLGGEASVNPATPTVPAPVEPDASPVTSTPTTPTTAPTAAPGTDNATTPNTPAGDAENGGTIIVIVVVVVVIAAAAVAAVLFLKKKKNTSTAE